MDNFDVTTLPIKCDGCEDRAAKLRPKSMTFWCDECVDKLAAVNVEV